MKIQFKKKYEATEPQFIVDYLAANIDLSKMKIKKGIELGGLWFKKNGQKKKARVKKIKTLIQPNDSVEFYFDPNLVPLDTDLALEIYKGMDFGIWYKPVNMLSDGSPFSDKGSLSYAIKSKSKKCFLIQRLDREVGGLMLVAYSKRQAAFFSKELVDKKIKKMYQVEVMGFLEGSDSIDKKIDGKDALTHYQFNSNGEGSSFLDVEIETGRFHQIRRHFDSIGHAVIGDPRYGEGNKNKDGLKLVANKVEFFDPQKRERVLVKLDQKYCLF